ncbi:MAG: guanylate kinase [Chloroflexi bacterium]|nr:guanylate kinase [Chloroflexota bacterium]
MQIDQENSRNLVVVISGPSGVGKDATIALIKQSGVKFHHVTTATTRDKRRGETDGKDYFFISRAAFKEKIGKNEFLEYAEVYGNYYGVPKSQVRQGLNGNIDVLIKVDVQGAITLKEKIPDAVFIFLLPPSAEDLHQRIKDRKADKKKDVGLRMRMLTEELKSLSVFDYAVINHNNDLDKTVTTVKAIITAEKCRVKKRVVTI